MLVSEGKLPPEHAAIASDFEAVCLGFYDDLTANPQVATQLEQHKTMPNGMKALNQSQMQHIGKFYNRAHYVVPGPRFLQKVEPV